MEGPDFLLLTDLILLPSAARNSSPKQARLQHIGFSSECGNGSFMIRLRGGTQMPASEVETADFAYRHIPTCW